jgi:hypothetical protein
MVGTRRKSAKLLPYDLKQRMVRIREKLIMQFLDERKSGTTRCIVNWVTKRLPDWYFEYAEIETAQKGISYNLKLIFGSGKISKSEFHDYAPKCKKMYKRQIWSI